MEKKLAKLYRMDMPGHTCPYGLKARQLLRSKGYQVEDHIFRNRVEVDQFKREHSVETTPQTFIEGKRVGGYTDLKKYFNPQLADSSTTYKPIIAIFSMTALMALALDVHFAGEVMLSTFLSNFVALSMCVLALQKLQDVEAFSLQFLNYDLLAKRFVPYATLYPFLEAFVGLGMLLGYGASVVGILSVFIGSIGLVSIFKAVYIEKRELKCACTGGHSRVPLGVISMAENIAMIAMGLWMGLVN